MFKWLTRKLDDAQNAAAEREITKFLSPLQGGSNLQIAEFLIFVHLVRLEHPEKLSDEVLYATAADLESMEKYPHRSDVEGFMMGVAKELASNGNIVMANAVKVWVYTLWAYRMPDLRPLLCDVWLQLSRGFPELENARNARSPAQKARISDALLQEATRIPAMFFLARYCR